MLALRLKIGWILNKVHVTENWVMMNQLIARRGGVYVWNIVIVLILTGVLPALAAFKVAYNAQMKLFIKHEQLTVARALKEREDRVMARYSTRRSNVTNEPAFNNEDAAREFRLRRLDDPLQSHKHSPLDVYTAFFYGTNWQWGDKGSPLHSTVIDSIDSLVPFFNESTVETRALTHKEAADQSFQWEESGPNIVLDQTVRAASNNVGNASDANTTHLMATPLEPFGPPHPFRSFRDFGVLVAWIAAFLLILLVIFLVARLVVRKVFLLNVTRDLYPKTVVELEAKQNLFLVNHLPVSGNGLAHIGEYFNIDLASDVSANGWVEKIEQRLRNESPPANVMIRHFEYGINDPVISDQKLRLLESLLDARRIVVIMSSLEPAAYFPPSGNSSNNGHHANAENTSERWARAVSRFKKLYTAPRRIGVRENALTEIGMALSSENNVSDEKRKRVLELAAQVYEECAAFPSLEDLSSDIIARLPFEDRKWNQIQQEISDRAELYYQQIWENCSDGERLTLMHLAQDRLLSPNDPDIAPLLHKHLIMFAPDLRPMNETFKDFVLARTANENLRVKETQAKSASQWEAFKIPLFVAFAAVVVFLVFTQKDLYNSSWTLLTALTTGVPAVFKVVSLFQGGGGKIVNT